MKALLLAVALAAIGALQTYFMSVRVAALDAWPEGGVFLRTDGRWRFGYVYGIHGAILFKTTAPVVPRPVSESDDGMPPEFYPEVSADMARVLDGLPGLQLQEGAFYFLGVLFVMFVLPAILRRRGPEAATDACRARAWGLMSALTLGYVMLPYVATCYGGSAYSTWAGPHAMSSSGPYLPPSLWPGETISYRPVLEIALLPVMVLPWPFRLGGSIGFIVTAGLYGWVIARAAQLVRRASRGVRARIVSRASVA